MSNTDPWGRVYGRIPYNGDPCFLVKSPCDYAYMKVLRFFLRCVSGWPLKELGEEMLFFEGTHHAIYNTAMSILFFVLQLWFLIDNAMKLTFFELGHMYVALLMNVLSTSRGFTLCVSQQYRRLAARFLTETHVLFHKDQSDYARHVYKQVHNLSNWFSIYVFGIFGITLILFNVVPVYMNYSNGKFKSLDNPVNTTYELSIYFKLPIDPERNFKHFCYSLVLNWYASYLCAASVIMFDLLLSIIIFNLWGHFKILLHGLVTFPKPVAVSDNDSSPNGFQRVTRIYSSQEQEMISGKLKESILYHRFITDFTNEMSECFGIVLFVYYTFHQVSGCLMLLECTQSPEALARYLPLTVMMTAQLIQISIIFEIIGSMSEKIKDEVYCLPWEYMDAKNKTTVMIFLINVQKPIHVKAGGLVDVGVTTMAGILKASLSYFAFLRTMSFKQ